MNTQTKILAALLLVTITALTITATLGYFIYERTLSGLATSRFEFIAKELKRKVEAGLDFGLPLGELENMNDLLRQEILTDTALARLSIENAKGIILFDTQASRIGGSSASAWLEALADGAGPNGSGLWVGQSEIGVPLVNSFGKVVGGLLVGYSKSYYDAKRATTIRDVGETTLIVLLLCSLVGVGGVLAISRPLDYLIMRLEASLQTILGRVDFATEESPAETDLERDIITLERKVLRVVQALECAEANAAAASPSLPQGHR